MAGNIFIFRKKEDHLQLIATSDIHGYTPKIQEPCDIYIIAGDICPISNHELYYQYEWLENPFYKFLEKIPAKSILIVAGNHDFALQTKYGKRIMNEFMPPNVRYLEDEFIEIDNKTFYGTPWTPRLSGWAFSAEGSYAENIFKKIPDNLDVLISHGPPKGYGDKVSMSYEGSKELLDQVEQKKPKIMICGHIHEGYGHYCIPGCPTEIYNVSYLNRHYEPTNKPVKLEI